MVAVGVGQQDMAQVARLESVGAHHLEDALRASTRAGVEHHVATACFEQVYVAIEGVREVEAEAAACD